MATLTHLGISAMIALSVAAKATPQHAPALPTHACQPAPLQSVGGYYPSFTLNDPRTGLLLHLERDGRNMWAATPQGKIVWQRNLFADPRLERELGPLLLPGDPPSSAKRLLEGRRAEINNLYITGIAVVPDCEAYSIDHNFPPPFRGHYISAGTGTKYMYLLDAKTGDFLVYGIN